MQETRRPKETQFSGKKKKYCMKGKMDSLWASRISHHLMDRAMKQSTHQFHKIFFHISKCLACNAEKLLQLKITKKRMNITNFINIYTNIDTYIICDKNDSK